MFALSVSISTSSSPLETSSPSDFSHLRIVPSSMESDRRGMATSDMASGYGKREAEDRTTAVALVDPDPPAVAFDDLAADRETDAGALVLLAVVEAAEHLEDLLAPVGRDTDAAVGDGDLRHPGRAGLVAHPDLCVLVCAELQGVRDQVLQRLL